MPELIAIAIVIVGLAVLARVVARRTPRETGDTGDTGQAARAGSSVALVPATATPDTADGQHPRDDKGDSPAALGSATPPRRATGQLPPARLFAMGDLAAGSSGGYRHRGPYAVLGLATTGFTPMRDHIVEIAIVHTDQYGAVTDEYATLVGCPGVEVPTAFLHGIDAADLTFRPTFAQVADQVLGRLEGHVVVAHNAEMVEQFLSAEFLRAGLLAPSLPTLNLIRLGQRVFPTRNQRLSTVAAHLRLPGQVFESAATDAHLTAGLLRTVLAGHSEQLAYPIAPAPVLNRAPRPTAPAPRSRPHTAGERDSWIAALLGRVSMSATEANDPRVAAYLEAMASILTRGRIVTQEARALTALLAASGYPAAQIRDILERLLESLREAAFEEPRLSTAQLSHLRAAAVSAGIPTYFDDLIPPPPQPAPRPGSGSFARPVRKPLPPSAPQWAARCGHCLSVGHYTSTCPRLRGGRVSPVQPIDPI